MATTIKKVKTTWQTRPVYCFNSNRELIVNWQHPRAIKKIEQAYVKVTNERSKRREEARIQAREHHAFTKKKKTGPKINKRGHFAVNEQTAINTNVKVRQKMGSKNRRDHFLLKTKEVTCTPVKLKRNMEFFSAADGVYNSYWVGKLITMLLHQGKKKIVARGVYRAFAIVKYTLNTNPLLLFLEILDKIKPAFRLRNYIIRRVVIKEYPIVSHRSRQFMIALHWLKNEIKKGSELFGQSLAQRVALKLLNFKANPKKDDLTKKRIEYTKRIIMGQFNIRYNWKKRR